LLAALLLAGLIGAGFYIFRTEREASPTPVATQGNETETASADSGKSARQEIARQEPAADSDSRETAIVTTDLTAVPSEAAEAQSDTAAEGGDENPAYAKEEHENESDYVDQDGASTVHVAEEDDEDQTTQRATDAGSGHAAAETPETAAAPTPLTIVPLGAWEQDVSAGTLDDRLFASGETKVEVQAVAAVPKAAPHDDVPAAKEASSAQNASGEPPRTQSAEAQSDQSETAAREPVEVGSSSSALQIAEPEPAATSRVAAVADDSATEESGSARTAVSGKEAAKTKAEEEKPKAATELALFADKKVGEAEVRENRKAKSERPREKAEQPTFSIVRVEPDGSAVIAGRAPPESRVVLSDDKGKIGEAAADFDGNWVMIPELPLRPGSRTLQLVAYTGDGRILEARDALVVYVPNQQSQIWAGAPQSDAPNQSNAPKEPLVVLAPKADAPAAPTRVVQAPGRTQLESGALRILAVDYDLEGRMRISGQAPPGGLIQVYLDNEFFGRIKADPAGQWVYVPDATVAPGLHSLRADWVDSAGKVLARVETPFVRIAPPIVPDNENFVVVQPGNSLWVIARRSYGRGILYHAIYAANEDQIRDPDLIYPGQVFLLPTIQ